MACGLTRVCGPLGITQDPLSRRSPAWSLSGPAHRDLFTCPLAGPPVPLSAGALWPSATTVAFPCLSLAVLPGFVARMHNDGVHGLRDQDGTYLSLDRCGVHSPRTFGHFGQSVSFLLVTPPTPGCLQSSLADATSATWSRQALCRSCAQRWGGGGFLVFFFIFFFFFYFVFVVFFFVVFGFFFVFPLPDRRLRRISVVDPGFAVDPVHDRFYLKVHHEPQKGGCV